MSERQAEYITDAMEMLGKGYDDPAIEITPPTASLERRDGKFQEVQKAAFVKISTSFKAEMKDIDEIALKVWLYIALSVNRYSGKANPGLRHIAKGTGLAVNTVRAAVERLENKYNLLSFQTGSGKAANIYEPTAFVSANRSVSADDTHESSVSDENASVSVDDFSVSVERQKNAQPELTRVNQNINNDSKPTIKSFAEYQHNIALLTPISSQEIDNLVAEYTDDWVCDAIRVAVNRNARNLKYIAAILRSWKEKGRNWEPEKKKTSRNQPSAVKPIITTTDAHGLPESF